MAAYLLRRSLQAFVAILGVLTLVFFLQRLTGDPVLLLLPDGATPADAERLRHALGFDRPLLTQYLVYLADLARLDLGRSVVQNLPVTDIIATRVPYTLMLAAGALMIAVAVGVPLGLLLGIARRGLVTHAVTALVLAGQSLPTFWSGILFILLFSVTLGWLPPSGASSLSSLVMPSLALGLLSMATFARVTRTAVLDELSKDYVRTARAKGLGTARLVAHHILRNASIPIVTLAALEIANLLAGAVIVETVFAWPGLGLLTIQSITARDFMVVHGIVLIGAVAAIGLNFAADVLYSLIDPRIRLGGRPA